MFALIGKARNHRVTWKGTRAAAAPLALRMKWATLFSDFVFARQACQSTGTGEPDRPPQAHYT